MDEEYFSEAKDLKGLVDATLYSLIAILAIVIYCGYGSHSLTMVAVAVEVFLSILLHIFNFVIIRCILRQNKYTFPLGAGKLENLSGFSLGLFYIPLALSVIFGAVTRAMHPPAEVHLGLAQVPMIFAIGRAGWLLGVTRRIIKKYPNYSPMTQSYDVNFKVTFVADTLILAGLMLGALVMRDGRTGLAVQIDLGLSALIALYMLFSGLQMVKRNFPSLADLPLSENDQLKILNAVSPEFDLFENIGNVYSHLSGGKRIIQIELIFRDATTIGELDGLHSRIENRLREHFGRVSFYLLPRSNQDS